MAAAPKDIVALLSVILGAICYLIALIFYWYGGRWWGSVMMMVCFVAGLAAVLLRVAVLLKDLKILKILLIITSFVAGLFAVLTVGAWIEFVIKTGSYLEYQGAKFWVSLVLCFLGAGGFLLNFILAVLMGI